MSAVNNCTFVGRLTNDPIVESTGSGGKLARFTLAVHRGKDAADFIPCTAWDSNAEFAVKYFTKGSPAAVTGELRTSKSQRDGVTRTFYDVRVNDIKFVPGSSAGSTSSESRSAGYAEREEEPEEPETPF